MLASSTPLTNYTAKVQATFKLGAKKSVAYGAFGGVIGTIGQFTLAMQPRWLTQERGLRKSSATFTSGWMGVGDGTQCQCGDADAVREHLERGADPNDVSEQPAPQHPGQASGGDSAAGPGAASSSGSSARLDKSHIDGRRSVGTS